jgi:hypothetical protein
MAMRGHAPILKVLVNVWCIERMRSEWDLLERRNVSH